MISENTPRHLNRVGSKIQKGWKEKAKKHKLKIKVDGIPALSHFSFKHEDPLMMKTLFTQLMLERGFLATTNYYASHAHTQKHVKDYLTAVDETFKIMKKPKGLLKGPVCHDGFERLT